MKKRNIRRILIVICLFLMMLTMGARSYAYTTNGSGPVTKSVAWNGVISTSTTKKIHFITDMQKLKMIANREIGVSGTYGIYCMWHGHQNGYEPGKTNNALVREVGNECNDLRYIFALEDSDNQNKVAHTDNFKKGLIQNFLWWTLSGKGDSKNVEYGSWMKTYNGKKWFQLTYAKSEPLSTKFNYETIANANNDYNIYSKDYLEDEFKKAKVTAAESDTINLYTGDTYAYFGVYKMNAYTQFYSQNCQKVNNYTNYSGYGNLSKGPKRGGILSGIVGAQLVIKYEDGSSDTLKWSNGDILFDYSKTIKGHTTKKGDLYDSKYNEKYFPAPGAEFWVKVKKGKIKSGKKMTVTLKFTSIKVKATEIKQHQANMVELMQNNKYAQPKLVCGGKMQVTKWTSATTCQIGPPTVGAKINVYVSKVEGGGADNKDVYPSNYITSDKYAYTESGKIERDVGKKEDIGHVQCPSETGLKIGTPKSSRANWSEAKKKRKTAIAEKGDTVTFTVNVTNIESYPIYVQTIKLSGCFEGNRKMTIQYGDKTETVQTEDSTATTTILKNVKIPSKGTKTFTCKVEGVTTGKKKYLQGKIGNIAKKKDGNIVAKGTQTSRDQYVFKNYYVTIDKYICGDDIKGFEEENFESGGNSPYDPALDASDNSDDGDTDDEDDSGDESSSGADEQQEELEDSKVYLGAITSETLKVAGIHYQAVKRADNSGIACYYHDGKYYYYDPMYLVMVPLTEQKDDSGKVFVKTDEANLENIHEQKVYLNWDGANIVYINNGDTLKFGTTEYYPVYDERYNPSVELVENHIACYYNSKNGKYYIVNDEADTGDWPSTEFKKLTESDMKEVTISYDANLPYITVDLGDNESDYTDADAEEIGDPDGVEKEVLSNVDDSGKPTGSASTTSSAWYPIYSKEDSSEIVCYYHKGQDKYYIKDGSNYEMVEIEKDSATGEWHVKLEDSDDSGESTSTEADENKQAKVYIEVSESGALVWRDSTAYSSFILEDGTTLTGPFKEVRDISGENIIAYYHPTEFKYIYVSGDFAKVISIRGEEPVFYFLESSLSAEGNDSSDIENEMETDTYHYPLCPVPSGEAHKRKQTEDDVKKVIPAEVNVGDEVTYKMVLYNTGNTKKNNEWLLNCTGNDCFGRRGSSYFKPGGVFVTVEDTLPTKYIESLSKINVKFKIVAENEYTDSSDGDKVPSSVSGRDGREFTKDINVSSGKFTVEDVYVPAGGCTILTYTVKATRTDGSAENKATITDIKNGNGKSFVDLNKAPDARKTSSDFFGKPGNTEETPDDQASVNVNVTKVQHNSDTGTKTTFQGSAKEAYAEYGDRVEFEINVSNTYTAKQSYNFDCWEKQEPTDQDLATVTLRIELPEEIYQESSKYKILIDGKQYDINTSQRTGVMWQFENKPEIKDNRTITSRNVRCQTSWYHETHCSLYACWETHHETWGVDHTHWKKVGASTTCKLTNNSTKVEIVNISNDKNVDVSKLTLKATLENIEYKHRYGFYYKSPVATYHSDGRTSYHYCEKGDPYDVVFNYDGTYTGASKGGSSCNTGIHTLNEGIQDKSVEGWTGGNIFDQANYKMNDYALQIDQYVNQYNGEMETYNRAHKFSTETGNYQVENNIKDKNYDANPQMVEKYETMTLLTVATNVAPSTEEDENNTSSPGKYKTRVRPDIIYQTLDAGLKVIPNTVRIKKNNGQDITNMFVSTLNEAENRMEYVVIQGDNELTTTLLSPGETIYYYVDVHVIESNMSLDTIRSTSVSMQLSNVNHQKQIDSEFKTDGKKKERIVYEPKQNNVCKQNSDIVSFKMKDLIMAGTVWVDGDRDGYKNSENDKVKKDVVVHLYKTTDGGETGTEVKTVTTREDGTYTFDRQAKTDNGTTHNAYYIEFEYDGLFYKASEVYGGVGTGEADGAANLDGSTGNYAVQWLQGHDDLTSTVPYTNLSEGAGPISGKTEYMTDSNAYEFDDKRNDYDAKHEKVAFNATYNKDLTKTDDLAYTKTGHVSKLDERATGERIMTARSFIKQSYQNSSGVNSTDANNTNTLFLNQYASYNRKTPTPKPETEYLKYVNLSLVRREEVDLSIDADVYSVKTTVNGEEMQYVFDENQQNDGGDNDNNSSADREYYDNSTNAYKLKNAYNLELYKSDYYYRCDDYYGKIDYYGEKVPELETYKSKDSEENIEVTYRICVRNKKIENDEPKMDIGQDIPIQTALNELVVYYDSKFKNAINDTTPVKIKNENTGLWETEQLPNVYARYSRNESDLNKVGVNGVNHRTIDGTGAKVLNVSEKSKFSANEQASEGESGDTGYSVLHLSSERDKGINNEYLSEGESLYIDITFIVRKKDLPGPDGNLPRSLDMYSKNDLALEMVAEVGGYTTKYREDYAHKGLAGNVAGLVDRDSNPSNVRKLNGGVDAYEDDTYAVGVKIELRPDTPPPGGGGRRRRRWPVATLASEV